MSQEPGGARVGTGRETEDGQRKERTLREGEKKGTEKWERNIFALFESVGASRYNYNRESIVG